MEKAIKVLAEKVEQRVGKRISLTSDFEKLSHIFGQQNLKLGSAALRKVWEYFKGKERPSSDTLDKMALFVGFQSWKDFTNAFNGTTDGNHSFDDTFNDKKV